MKKTYITPNIKNTKIEPIILSNTSIPINDGSIDLGDAEGKDYDDDEGWED